MEPTEEMKRLVKERLSAMPPGVSFSIGEFGDFTPRQLIKEVEKNSEIGNEVVDMQINYIRKMPKLLTPTR